jgi:hypothetical protein
LLDATLTSSQQKKLNCLLALTVAQNFALFSDLNLRGWFDSVSFGFPYTLALRVDRLRCSSQQLAPVSGSGHRSRLPRTLHRRGELADAKPQAGQVGRRRGSHGGRRELVI